MIFSRWRPDIGGYVYFESPERLGLGDNLATPSLVEIGGIGAASTDAGRRPQGTLKIIGRGSAPVGCVMPLSRAGLAQVSMLSGLGFTGTLGLGCLLGGAAVFLWLTRGSR